MVINKYLASFSLAAVVLLAGCNQEPVSVYTGNGQRQEPTEEADIVLPPEELDVLKQEMGDTFSSSRMMDGRPRTVLTKDTGNQIAKDIISKFESELMTAVTLFQSRSINLASKSCPDEGSFINYSARNTLSSHIDSITFYHGGMSCIDFRKEWKWFGFIPRRVIVGQVYYHGQRAYSLGWNSLTSDLPEDDPLSAVSFPIDATYTTSIIDLGVPKIGSTALKEIEQELNDIDPSLIYAHNPASDSIISEINTGPIDYDTSLGIQQMDVRVNLDNNTMKGSFSIESAAAMSVEFNTFTETISYIDSEGDWQTIIVPSVDLTVSVGGFSKEGRSFNGSGNNYSLGGGKQEFFSPRHSPLVTSIVYNTDLGIAELRTIESGTLQLSADGNAIMTLQFTPATIFYSVKTPSENNPDLITVESGSFPNETGKTFLF